jgi:hypothetical protein
MKKILILLFISFNFLLADIYEDWTIQDLGSMVVLVKYSTDKLGMFTLGLSSMGNNIQIVNSKITSNKETLIKIDYSDDYVVYSVNEYTANSSIIIMGDIASFLIDKLYNAKKVSIYSDKRLVCEYELKNLTDLLNSYI